ncbi:MAG: hypothetical protein RBS99_07760 [Rhodospirillales bacterium]|jgi:hypothetical protein|nr:hypothetical protein [Rhodospirillales bacterium]
MKAANSPRAQIQQRGRGHNGPGPLLEAAEPLTDLMIEHLRREIEGKLMPGIVETPRDGRVTTAGGD